METKRSQVRLKLSPGTLSALREQRVGNQTLGSVIQGLTQELAESLIEERPIAATASVTTEIDAAVLQFLRPFAVEARMSVSNFIAAHLEDSVLPKLPSGEAAGVPPCAASNASSVLLPASPPLPVRISAGDTDFVGKSENLAEVAPGVLNPVEGPNRFRALSVSEFWQIDRAALSPPEQPLYDAAAKDYSG